MFVAIHLQLDPEGYLALLYGAQLEVGDDERPRQLVLEGPGGGDGGDGLTVPLTAQLHAESPQGLGPWNTWGEGGEKHAVEPL